MLLLKNNGQTKCFFKIIESFSLNRTKKDKCIESTETDDAMLNVT